MPDVIRQDGFLVVRSGEVFGRNDFYETKEKADSVAEKLLPADPQAIEGSPVVISQAEGVRIISNP